MYFILHFSVRDSVVFNCGIFLFVLRIIRNDTSLYEMFKLFCLSIFHMFMWYYQGFRFRLANPPIAGKKLTLADKI